MPIVCWAWTHHVATMHSSSVTATWCASGIPTASRTTPRYGRRQTTNSSGSTPPTASSKLTARGGRRNRVRPPLPERPQGQDGSAPIADGRSPRAIGVAGRAGASFGSRTRPGLTEAHGGSAPTVAVRSRRATGSAGSAVEGSCSRSRREVPSHGAQRRHARADRPKVVRRDSSLPQQLPSALHARGTHIGSQHPHVQIPQTHSIERVRILQNPEGLPGRSSVDESTDRLLRVFLGSAVVRDHEERRRQGVAIDPCVQAKPDDLARALGAVVVVRAVVGPPDVVPQRRVGKDLAVPLRQSESGRDDGWRAGARCARPPDCVPQSQQEASAASLPGPR